MDQLSNMNIINETAPKKEYIVTKERQQMINSMVAIYGECFAFSKNFLVGQALKDKFESVEKTMRKYRKIQEEKLSIVRKELAVAEKEYKQAVRDFEKMSLEELDPSKYDELVHPKEKLYQSLFRIQSNLSSIIQNIKMLTSKVFAKDKTQVLSMIHAHAIYLTIKLITVFNSEGSIKIDDEHFTKNVLPHLEIIRNNYQSIFSEFNKDTPIEDIVDFLHPIAEHSADQAAIRSRKSKELAFKCVDDLCSKYQVEIIMPNKTEDQNELEYELLVKGNQIKALNVLAKGKPVKNPDGTFSTYPKSSKDISEVIETLREAGYYLSGITTIMSEEFISNLPLRDDSIRNIYLTDIPRLTKVIFDMSMKDNSDITIQKLLISHILMSVSIIDQIPTLILYI